MRLIIWPHDMLLQFDCIRICILSLFVPTRSSVMTCPTGLFISTTEIETWMFWLVMQSFICNQTSSIFGMFNACVVIAKYFLVSKINNHNFSQKIPIPLMHGWNIFFERKESHFKCHQQSNIFLSCRRIVELYHR